LLNYPELLVLGAIAGFTIFLGLPLVALQNVSSRTKGFLNSISIGILFFLIIDVFSNAWGTTSTSVARAVSGSAPFGNAFTNLIALFSGLALGLLGLVYYESKYMRGTPGIPVQKPEGRISNSSNQSSGPSFLVSQVLERPDAYRLSTMIAIGIGAHNFSEGLAIGQSFVSGAIGLALVLVIGFGSHNATEGFGIAGPLTGLSKRPSTRFIITVGLVGGGPTFVGTLVGSLIGVSSFAYVLFLSVAGGALIYVALLMYNTGRRQTTNRVLMTGIFVGLCLGFITDLIVTIGGA
jgi:ZIP family zinc transporter